MSDDLAPLKTFHLSGERTATDLGDIAAQGLRPALFSGYGDLSRLRYDYPLILVDGAVPAVRSLTDIVDGVLREIAPPGIEGERTRRHVLRLEREIRASADVGMQPLSRLWQRAEGVLLAGADETARPALSDILGRARAALDIDGPTVGCDRETPVRVLTHAWSAAQVEKARRLDDAIDALVLRLSDILKADSMKSKEAVGAEVLKRSVGSAFEAAFDFDVMSRLLARSFPDATLPEKRRRRIRSVLSALQSQRFFARAGNGGGKKGYVFAFDRCAEALEAYRQRLPAMVELVKAMTIARLEIDNRYKDASHDPFFRRFDERFLEADDLTLFPSYLVRLRNGIDAREETAPLFEILSSGLPIKVLVQNDGVLAELSEAAGASGFGVIGPRLATMALGLDTAFVLQTSGAGLYRARDAIGKGLAGHGPALFSVYSGASGTMARPAKARNVPSLSPYLRAAAAVEARAFPAFVYDPAAGADWASRFSLAGNPQAEADWPTHRLAFEDDELQRVSEETAFTFVDFIAADERHGGSFAIVPRSKWHRNMVPVREFLELDAGAAADKVPYVLMIDDSNGVHRVIVAQPLIEAARGCRARWRSLQELAGINNSHAARAVAAEKQAWQGEKDKEPTPQPRRPAPAKAPIASAPANVALAPTGTVAVPAAATAEAAAAPEAVPAESAAAPAVPSDEAYIETPRCTSCDECTQINNRMFAYDDNKQAYITDPDAGTYRQLVEAAENCQVAIIHPGKPRNPNEPGLAELMARAEPFN